MKEINYLEIIKKAWSITWHNKFLWWFGLFLALGGGFNFNFNIPHNDLAGNLENKGASIENFLAEYWIVLSLIVAVVIALMLVIFVLKTISFAGLLRALTKIEKKESASFREEFKNGKRFFWRIVGVKIIIGIFIFGIFIVLFIPALFSLLYFESFTLGLILAFLGMLIIIPLIVLAVYLNRYACFYAVLSNLGIKESLENAYKLFQRNMLPSILMSLLFIPIGMLMALIFIGLIFVLALVFMIPGLTAYFFFSTSGVVTVSIIAGLILLVSFVFASSIYMTFVYATWFLFFREIATIKEDPIKEVEPEVIENLPNPEEA